jgi:AcrR family transcriptional regulator
MSRRGGQVPARERSGDQAQVEKSPAARRALLQAAQRLFADRGYRDASVIDIVELAGSSVGTLYYYFGSKADLYLQTWADFQTGQEQRAKDAVARVRASGEESGLRLCLVGTRAYLNAAWENRDVVRMIADGDTPPGFQGLARQFTRRWVGQNEGLLNSGDAVTTRVLLAIVTDSIDGICREIAACRSRAEAGEIIERALDVFARIGRTDGARGEDGSHREGGEPGEMRPPSDDSRRSVRAAAG